MRTHRTTVQTLAQSTLRSLASSVVVVVALVFSQAIPGFRTDDRAGAQTAARVRSVLILLCKYADVAADYANVGISPARVQSMWVGDNSIDGVLQEVSLGTMNLSGSRAFGWFTLPNAKAAYPDSIASHAGIVTDCVAAARAGGVDVGPYSYVAVFLNGDLAGAAARMLPMDFGGTQVPPAQSRAMIFAKSSLTSPQLVLHELGHALSGEHTQSTSDPLGWAGFGDSVDAPPTNRPLTNGRMGPGWDGANRDLMGFIPAARKIVFQGGTQTIAMSRLTQPLAAGAMVVDVPIGAGTAKYIVSARTLIGYDRLPEGSFDRPASVGVMIHKFDGPAGNPAIEVMMSRPGGERRSTDSVWLAGQTFTDPTNNIRITVNRFDDNGAEITLTGPVVPTTTTTTTTTPSTLAPMTTTTTEVVAPPTTFNPTTPALPAGPAADNIAASPIVVLPMVLRAQLITTATFEADEQRPCAVTDHSVWIKFTAPRTALYVASTVGSDFDTVIAAYNGAATDPVHRNLTVLGCNDDISTTIPQSSITFTAAAGTTVYIQAAAFTGGAGTLVMTVR